MKQLFFYIVIFILFTACNQNTNTDNSNKVFGAPQATITNQPNNDTANKGPLAFGPEVTKLQDGDTVDVKFDVTHKLFRVSNDVSFTAWMFGNSVPACFKSPGWTNGSFFHDGSFQ